MTQQRFPGLGVNIVLLNRWPSRYYIERENLLNLEDIFGRYANLLLDAGSQVVEELRERPVRYEFMVVQYFEELMRASPREGNRVLLTELLYRTHLAAAASLVRSLQWVQGCLQAGKLSLFLPFCGSLRGLLESVADAEHSLGPISLTLSERHRDIRFALRGRARRAIFDIQPIEDLLVHFTEARRLSKDERKTLPQVFRPREMLSYISDTLDQREPFGFSELYSELCEFSHPAASSIKYMLASESDGATSLQVNLEEAALADFVRRHQARCQGLLMVQVNYSLVTLWVLNQFPIAEVHTRAIRKMRFDTIPLWVRCHSALNARPA